MSDPYLPPDAELNTPAEYTVDGWDRGAQGVLLFCGFMYVVLGLGMGVVLPMDDEMPLWLSGGFALIIFMVCGVFGALNVAVAWGIGERRKWAWFGSVILGGIYAPSGCMPFGVVLLYAMLREPGRKAFKI